MKKWFRNLWIGLLSGTAFLTACGLRPSPTYYGSPNVDEDLTEGRMALQQRLDSIRDIIEERESAKIYGSPEVMERYRTETSRMRAEADSISRKIEDFDK